jgi:hypothetical protein
LQVSTPADSAQVPCVGVAPTNTAPVGTVSVRTTLLAAFGPLLSTRTVYVKTPPAGPGSGESDWLTTRSAFCAAAPVAAASSAANASRRAPRRRASRRGQARACGLRRRACDCGLRRQASRPRNTRAPGMVEPRDIDSPEVRDGVPTARLCSKCRANARIRGACPVRQGDGATPGGGM